MSDESLPMPMSQAEVAELMAASTNEREWNANCELVKLLFGGSYPSYWKELLFAQPDGLAWRKEREWQQSADVRVRRGDELEELAAPIPPPPRAPGFVADIIIADYGPTGALRALRMAMREIGVTPQAWSTALGTELSNVLGAQWSTYTEEQFRVVLESILEALRQTSRDVRQRCRQRDGLPNDPK